MRTKRVRSVAVAAVVAAGLALVVSACGSGGGSNGGSSGGSNGGSNDGGGEAIRGGEPTTLAWVEIYLLDPTMDKAEGAVFIGAYKAAAIATTTAAVAKGAFSRNIRPLDINN